MEDMELNTLVNTETADNVMDTLPVTTSRITDHLICFGIGALGGLACDLVLKPVGKKVWRGLKKLTAKKPAEPAAPAETEEYSEETTDTPDKEA